MKNYKGEGISVNIIGSCPMDMYTQKLGRVFGLCVYRCLDPAAADDEETIMVPFVILWGKRGKVLGAIACGYTSCQ